jgi:hypothetical protein
MVVNCYLFLYTKSSACRMEEGIVLLGNSQRIDISTWWVFSYWDDRGSTRQYITRDVLYIEEDKVGRRMASSGGV